MELLNKKLTSKKERPIKILQYGEGNFLRAFVDYMIDITNESGMFDGDIVIVKPIQFGSLERFERQESQYTVVLRGIADGGECMVKRQITSVADTVDPFLNYDKYMEYALLDSLRFVVSNTTEAGIVFDESDSFENCLPKSYPGKLTKMLFERYRYFNGNLDSGLIILPVELIDDNGIQLKKCVERYVELWKLEPEFLKWINDSCIFCSTLVDRIVTGYPKSEDELLWKELGYKDELLVTGEPFALWVIESSKDISSELPLKKAGLPVIFTDNQKPYKQRKVRILNGAHTSFVLASYLAGNDYVRESMEDPLIKDFMYRTIFDEVIPTLTLPKAELIDFANSVIERFNNPYIKHALLSISLNSISKWRARCMPSFLEYIQIYGNVPAHLSFSIAALVAFYTGNEIRDGALIGHRGDEEYRVIDDAVVLEFFAENSRKSALDLMKLFLSDLRFFGEDLTAISGVLKLTVKYLDDIREHGMRSAIEMNF